MLPNRFTLHELHRLSRSPMRTRFGPRLTVTGGCQFDHDKPEDGYLALIQMGGIDVRLDRDELHSVLRGITAS